MEKIWFQHYSAGLPHEINPDKYTSVVEVFEKCCAKYGNNPAFVNMGKTLTFTELDVYAKNFAAFLQNHTDLKPGDRIAIQVPNTLQYPIAMYGALRAGLIIVNTNPLYTPREMEHQFKDSGAKAILIAENFASHLQSIIKSTDIKHVILTGLGDRLGFPKSLIVNFVVKYVKKMVPPYQLPGAVWFNDALSKGASSKYTRPTLNGEDIAFLQYTGGTTGVSKGAMLTHRNLVANMEQISAWIAPILSEGKEIVITPLPLYHVFALTVNCLAFIQLGGMNVLITNPRDIPGFVKELSKYKFTLMTGVNTLFNALLHNEEFGKLDFSSLKMSAGGGMAVQKAVVEKWEKVTKTKLLEGFGLTEASPVTHFNPLTGGDRVGFIGVPVSSTDSKIVDDAGNEVPPNTPGEICVKGPQVMKGYWQRPEATAEVIKDGWLYTGDIGLYTEDGFFKIVDRKKEMLIVSGFNVFPSEIEDVLAMHPGVLEVAVIGLPDEKSGEVPKAFIIKKDPKLTEEALEEFCKKELTNYKRPKYYEFRKELPKTNVGKILRRKLKEEEDAKNKREVYGA